MILPPDPIEMDLTGYSHRWRILNLVSRAVLIEAQGTPGWVHLYKIRMLFGAYPNLSQEVDAAMSGRMVKVLVGSVRVAVRRRVRSPYDYAINPDRLPLLQRQLVQCDYWRANGLNIGPHTAKVAEAILRRRVHVILGAPLGCCG